MTYICWSVHQRGRCEEVNITAVCNKQGQWDPSIDDICAGITFDNLSFIYGQCIIITIGAFLSEGGKIAVASLTTFIVSSFTFFIFGYFCHHRRQKQTLPPQIESSTPMYETVLPPQDLQRDMELQENVAYCPLASNN